MQLNAGSGLFYLHSELFLVSLSICPLLHSISFCLKVYFADINKIISAFICPGFDLECLFPS